MTEAQPVEPESQSEPSEDPSEEVADTQAPAHLEEKGIDPEAERALEEGADQSDE